MCEAFALWLEHLEDNSDDFGDFASKINSDAALVARHIIADGHNKARPAKPTGFKPEVDANGADNILHFCFIMSNGAPGSLIMLADDLIDLASGHPTASAELSADGRSIQAYERVVGELETHSLVWGWSDEAWKNLQNRPSTVFRDLFCDK